MKIFMRTIIVMLVLTMLTAVLPMQAFATESSTSSTSSTTSTTATTTTKADAVSLSSLYIVGSNNKNYLADPSLTVGVDKYSFYLPDWMETCKLIIKSSSDFKPEAEGVTFEGSSGSYTGEFKLESKKNTFSVKLTSGESTRTLTIVIYLSNIPCKLESVSILRNSEVVKTFDSEPEKGEYSFASGTTTGVSLRIVPRHEQTVSVTNLTGIPESQITGNETATVLTLHETYKRYDHNLTLVEGTNVFLIKVKAGTVEKTCRLTIIVGDAMANMTTTTQSTETTTIPTNYPQTTTIAPLPGINDNNPGSNDDGSGGTDSSFPPVLWVTIGVVIAIVIGACVFMIVNMGNRDNNNGGYGGYGGDGYYDDYDRQPRYPAARRNLADYIDDDYPYAPPPPQRGRGSGGYGGYNSNSYNNYSDGYNPDMPENRSNYGGFGGGGDYSGGFQSDYDYDDGYGSGTPRGSSSSLGGFESDDDYGNGNYYGGY